MGRVAWEKVWNKVVEFAESTWSTLMSISYAFAIVAMMVSIPNHISAHMAVWYLWLPPFENADQLTEQIP